MLRVSAPGKVILFGDHSVVYGRQAIAAALSLRSSLTFHPRTPSEPTDDFIVHLDFPGVGLQQDIDLKQLYASRRACADRPARDVDSALLAQVTDCLAGGQLSEVARAAASAFLYLFCHIVDDARLQACLGTYRITSELPIGAGLGSSASVSVVIATTLLINTGRIHRPATTQANAREATLELINAWAYAGEQVIHGTPSGVDNTVATYGRGLVFRKGQPHKLIAMPELPLLLTNTGVPRSTMRQVSKVADRRSDLPTIVEPVLDAMHGIGIEAEKLLAGLGTEDTVAKLGLLIEMNQDLLAALGVSHPAIDATVARNRRLGYTKLVGAGGGGCVVTLLDPSTAAADASVAETRSAAVTDVVSDLGTYNVTLGGPGVGIHDAVEETTDPVDDGGDVCRHY